jgi:hypothetical protein
MSDCSEPIKSDPKLLTGLRGATVVASAGASEGVGASLGGVVGSLAAGTSTDESTWFGEAGGSVCETVGWLRESMKSY